MNRFYNYLLLFLFFISFIQFPATLLGQGFGSKNLLYVQTASTLEPKRLEFRSNFKYFSKLGDYYGEAKPADFSAINYQDAQFNAILTYGIVEHLDISSTVRIYQDVNKGSNKSNIPDDLFLDIKGGSFGIAGNKINLGGQISLRFPIGKNHNYPFESYTAGSTEIGGFFLFSYYQDPFLPHRALSLHANLGYYYHRDAGKTLFEADSLSADQSPKIIAQNNASALRCGIGLVYPTELFNFNIELWGNYFISEPDTFAFSRENYTYITPSMRFKPSWRFSIDLGLDVRLFGDKNSTSSMVALGGGNLDLPNYPSWKLTVGINFVVNKATYKKPSPTKPSYSEASEIRNSTSNNKPTPKQPQQSPQKVTYYALLIAVNDYQQPDLTDLDNPIKDATRLRDVLTQYYIFDPPNVSILQNPNRAEIIDAFEKLKEIITEDDNFLVFFAGHGFWDKDANQGYWLPSNASKKNKAEWLSNSDIRDHIKAIKTKHTLLISDACFSGAILKTRSSLSFYNATDDIRKLYSLPSRKAISSGVIEQVPDKSVFAYYLIKQLVNDDRTFFSSLELFNSIRTPVINNSPLKQVPQFGEIRECGDEGGDFIFVKRKKHHK